MGGEVGSYAHDKFKLSGLFLFTFESPMIEKTRDCAMMKKTYPTTLNDKIVLLFLISFFDLDSHSLHVFFFVCLR